MSSKYAILLFFRKPLRSSYPTLFKKVKTCTLRVPLYSILTWYLTLLRVVRILGLGFPLLSRVFPFNEKVVSNWIVDINMVLNVGFSGIDVGQCPVR